MRLVDLGLEVDDLLVCQHLLLLQDLQVERQRLLRLRLQVEDGELVLQVGRQALIMPLDLEDPLDRLLDGELELILFWHVAAGVRVVILILAVLCLAFALFWLLVVVSVPYLARLLLIFVVVLSLPR